MTVTFYDPEIETQLQDEASVIGVPVSDFILSVLRERVVKTRPLQRISMEEFDRLLDELSEGTEHLPPAPPGAFTRESFYSYPEKCVA